MKKKRIPREKEKLITIDQVTDNDILSGRGGGKTHDENHQSYLDVIDQYHDEYVNVKDNAYGKKEVLDKVLKALHGRRFLIGVKGMDGVYREMTKKKIRNKVSQRLREPRQAKLPFVERRSQTYIPPKEREENDRIAKDTKNLITSDQVTEKDVLYVLGNDETHDANKHSYLDVIDKYHDEYVHGNKQDVLDQVIDALQNRDGRRFLTDVLGMNGVYREMTTKEIKAMVLNRLLGLDQAKLPFLERSSQTHEPGSEADDEPPAWHAHDAVVGVNNHEDTHASSNIPNDNDYVDLIRSDCYQEQDLPVSLVTNKSTLHDKIKEWRRQHEDGFTSDDDDNSSAGRINTAEVLAVDSHPTFFDDACALGMPNYQVDNDDPTDRDKYEPIDVNTTVGPNLADPHISAVDWDDVVDVTNGTSEEEFRSIFMDETCVENVGNV